MNIIQRECDSIRNHTKELAEIGTSFKRVGNEQIGMEITERAKLINQLVTSVEKTNAANTPEVLWDRFIQHLNQTQPLRSGPEHKNFLGSIEHYRKVFLESQQ